MIYLERNQVPAFLRNGYNGARLRAEPCTHMTIQADAGLWSGGSRETFSAIDLASGRTIPLPGQASSPWDPARQAREIEIKPGFAIVKHAIFSGNDMGLTFYVNPADIAALLPKPTESNLSDRELKVLAIIRGIKSSYRAEEYRRKGYSETEIENMKARFLELGLIDKRGAITTAGRNASSHVNAY